MKRILVSLVLISVAAALPGEAATKPLGEGVPPADAVGRRPKKPASRLGSLKTWFRTWKTALRKKAIQARYRRGISATSVAAIRGSKQSEANPRLPYWKGSWSDKKAAQRLEERKEQSAAIDLILEGKYDEAEKALDAFEKAHPKSAYLADIREARIKLAELKGDKTPAAESPVKDSPKAEPKEESKEEAKPAESPKE